MKKFYPLLFMFTALIFNVSCKDKVEEVQQDLVIAAMTNGQWKMTWFKENNVIDSTFLGYEFQYYTNYTVDAMKNGVTTRGNWGGNASSMTTNADFPASAGNPLIKLNGTWNILRNSWTYVEAQQVVGALVKTMRLDKK